MSRYFVIIPAAGTGSRIGADVPKQYLKVGGRTLLEHTLDIFCQRDDIEKIVLALRADDQYFDKISYKTSKVLQRVTGGDRRHDSVFCGLEAIKDECGEDDWVLVHDAARPCLRQKDLSFLMERLSGHPVGGLLAAPVRDTIKRTDKHQIISKTVNRDHLWHAQTPQMFRFGLLYEAMKTAAQDSHIFTDESSVMEHAGFQPLIVTAGHDNIKITHPEDLELAEVYLRWQKRI